MNAFAKYIANYLVTNYGKDKAIAIVKADLRKKVANSYATTADVLGMPWFNARASFTDAQVMNAIHTEVQAL